MPLSGRMVQAEHKADIHPIRRQTGEELPPTPERWSVASVHHHSPTPAFYGCDFERIFQRAWAPTARSTPPPSATSKGGPLSESVSPVSTRLPRRRGRHAWWASLCDTGGSEHRFNRGQRAQTPETRGDTQTTANRAFTDPHIVTYGGCIDDASMRGLSLQPPQNGIGGISLGTYCPSHGGGIERRPIARAQPFSQPRSRGKARRHLKAQALRHQSPGQRPRSRLGAHSNQPLSACSP